MFTIVGGGGRGGAVVATDSILSGAVVVGVLRGRSIEKRVGKERGGSNSVTR